MKEISYFSSKKMFLVQIEAGAMEVSVMEEQEKAFVAVGTFFTAILVIIFATLLIALPIQYIWNNVLLEVTTFCKEISFWQSASIVCMVFIFGRIFNFPVSTK